MKENFIHESSDYAIAVDAWSCVVDSHVTVVDGFVIVSCDCHCCTKTLEKATKCDHACRQRA